jgi:glycine cleavage system H protein
MGMEAPESLKYTSDHEWAEIDPQTKRVKMGITDYAQDVLGDIVFVQLPAVGTQVQMGLSLSEVESTKSVSDVYAPISGVVAEVNSELDEAPQHLNDDPYGDGWICVIEPSPDATFDHFLDVSAYRSLVDS